MAWKQFVVIVVHEFSYLQGVKFVKAKMLCWKDSFEDVWLVDPISL